MNEEILGDGLIKQLNNLDNDLIISKYMSIERFVSLLTSGSFWFSSPKSFEDKSESHYKIHELGLPNKVLNDWLNNSPGKLASLTEFYNEKLNNIFIHSWSREDNILSESNALWKIYVPTGMGFKLTTTVGHLLDSIEEEFKEFVNAKEVYYGYPKEGKSLIKYLTKTPMYEYEKEIRVLLDFIDKKDFKDFFQSVVSGSISNTDSVTKLKEMQEIGKNKFSKIIKIDSSNITSLMGVNIPVDLNKFFNEDLTITPSPYKSQWNRNILNGLLSDKGFSCKTGISLLQVD